MFEAFEEALANARTQTAFAKGVGCSQQLVSYLLKHRLPLSPKYVIRAETAFGVSRHRLRPDFYPCDEGGAHTRRDNSPDPFVHDAQPPVPHDGVVTPAAPIVVCDRSAVLHPGRKL